MAKSQDNVFDSFCVAIFRSLSHQISITPLLLCIWLHACLSACLQRLLPPIENRFRRDVEDVVRFHYQKKVRDSDAACEACEKWLDEHDPAWRDRIDEDQRRPWDTFRPKVTAGLSKPDEMDLLNTVCKARQAAATESAFRIEGILREYPAFAPVNLWFRYPLHTPDTTGVLGDIEPEESKAPWQRGTERNKENKPKRRDKRRKEFENAIAFAAGGEPPTAKEIAEYLDVTEGTVRNRMNEFGYTKKALSPDRWVVVKEGATDEKD